MRGADDHKSGVTLAARGGWLSGAVAVITGGVSGIGHAVAERFVREGARVAVLDRSKEGVERLRDEFKDAAVGVVGDVTSPEDNRSVLEAAIATFGRLDVFIGNAGIYDFSQRMQDTDCSTLSKGFDEIFSVNVKGYLIGARTTVDALRRTNGAMIFTVSTAGFYPGGGGVLYTASKHAVVGLIRQLAFELAPEIRVNGVAPGGTDTALGGVDALDQSAIQLDKAIDLGAAMSKTPLGFVAQPEDHTGAYVLLASRENSRAMTGVIIPSDGGMSVRGGGRRRTTS